MGSEHLNSHIKRSSCIVPACSYSLLNYCLKAWCKLAPELQPGNFRFGILLAMHPSMLDCSFKVRIMPLAEDTLCICNSIIFRTQITLCDEWNIYLRGRWVSLEQYPYNMTHIWKLQPSPSNMKAQALGCYCYAKPSAIEPLHRRDHFHLSCWSTEIRLLTLATQKWCHLRCLVFLLLQGSEIKSSHWVNEFWSYHSTPISWLWKRIDFISWAPANG